MIRRRVEFGPRVKKNCEVLVLRLPVLAIATRPRRLNFSRALNSSSKDPSS